MPGKGRLAKIRTPDVVSKLQTPLSEQKGLDLNILGQPKCCEVAGAVLRGVVFSRTGG